MNAFLRSKVTDKLFDRFFCVFSIFISFLTSSFFARSEAFVQVLSVCDDQHNQVYFKVQIPGSEKKGFAAHSLAFSLFFGGGGGGGGGDKFPIYFVDRDCR